VRLGENVTGNGFIAVGVGAALGAWLRWGLAVLLNSRFPALPPGTLAANVLGGFLIGMAMEWFSRHLGLPPEVRLLVVTGFLGGLTTYSTFSAEVVDALLRGHYVWSIAIAASHLAGSLLATVGGIAAMRWLSAS
jgi:CrcB protein